MHTQISKTVNGKKYTLKTNRPLGVALKWFKKHVDMRVRYELTCPEFELVNLAYDVNKFRKVK